MSGLTSYREKYVPTPSLLAGAGILAITLYLSITIIMAGVKVPRWRADQMDCFLNLKSLGRSLSLYRSDFDGRYPPADRWVDASLPYAKELSYYQCPAAGDKASVPYSYCYNTRLGGVKSASVSRPEGVPLLYDTDRLWRNANAPNLAGLAQSPRHRDVNNVVWADGHVREIPRPKPRSRR